MRWVSLLLLCFLSLQSALAEDKKDGAAANTADDYFAIIGGQKVPIEEFQATFRKGVRERFYHGKVSRVEVETFKKEVADKLVNEVLFVQEAKRRGIEVDQAFIKKKLEELDERNSKAKEWAQSKDKVLAIIKDRLTREALAEKLKENVQKIGPPNDEQVTEYYNKNQDKFTAPQQWGVSLIMLKVDPSSPSDIWAAAADEASNLVERIRSGADFKDLARIHSGDESAENGGDMGYLHIGMLAKPAQNVLNLMEVGEVSEPVMLLQGVAIFRLDGIKPARLNPLEKVRERAEQLWMRERSEQVWQDLIKKLRAETKIEYGKNVFDTEVAAEEEKK